VDSRLLQRAVGQRARRKAHQRARPASPALPRSGARWRIAPQLTDLLWRSVERASDSQSEADNGVRSLAVSCWICHHQAVLSADPWPDHLPVPTFGPRMLCTRCGIVGADARPNWKEQPPRETLTGVQWRS
jgi:hypothetical protein